MKTERRVGVAVAAVVADRIDPPQPRPNLLPMKTSSIWKRMASDRQKTKTSKSHRRKKYLRVTRRKRIRNVPVDLAVRVVADVVGVRIVPHRLPPHASNRSSMMKTTTTRRKTLKKSSNRIRTTSSTRTRIVNLSKTIHLPGPHAGLDRDVRLRTHLSSDISKITTTMIRSRNRP